MLITYKLYIQEVRESTIHKLLPCFSSPWRIIHQFDNSVTYKIRHPERGETKLINRDRLVIYKPNQGAYSIYGTHPPPRLFPSSITNTQHPSPTADNTPAVPTGAETTGAHRQLQTTIERQSHIGDPISWQYSACSVAQA